MTTFAADVPAYESAILALFAADKAGFVLAMRDWPEDYRDYFLRPAGLTGSVDNAVPGAQHE